MTLTIENLTSRHIAAVKRYATENRKHTLLQLCKRAQRRQRGGELNLGAMRDVAAAYNKLAPSGLLGAEHFGSREDARDPVGGILSNPRPAPTTLNLDAIDRVAHIPGSDAAQITRALTRRIRELEAKCRTTGESLANFIGEDEDEGRELAQMSADLIAMADKGTQP